MKAGPDVTNDRQSARKDRREARLPRKQFNAVRLCARGCLIDAGSDEQQAIALVRERMELAVGPIFLSIAIQIAIKLIMWWVLKGVTEPSVVSQTGEPGTSDDDDCLEGEYE